MSTATELVAQAFETMASTPGFVERSDQRQLALLISDLIEQSARGVFEAPTGLGKSLAALIPAIAHAIENRKRVVIATYTNVLAEQYWRQDLPFALSLFEGLAPKMPQTALLMGRSRYACLVSLEELSPEMARDAKLRGGSGDMLGIESEFREIANKTSRTGGAWWTKVSSPPVCPGRLCPEYDNCFYYGARTKALTAQIVITNHSVVLQDALVAAASDTDEGMLGEYDFLILDEAHDFPQAATSGLEFELSPLRLATLLAVSSRLERSLGSLAKACGDAADWKSLLDQFRDRVAHTERALTQYGQTLGRPRIMVATPPEVMEHPQVKAMCTEDDSMAARHIAVDLSDACDALLRGLDERLERWQAEMPDRVASDTVRNYVSFIREYGHGCHTLFAPDGVAVSYVGVAGNDAMLRAEVIDLVEPLRELIWDRVPYACLSATLAIDGDFSHFRRLTGVEPDFEEILPSPFDHPVQTAAYLPKAGAVPDPTVARRESNEGAYFRSIAAELTHIIRSMEGRTLVLFHSRREMEAVSSMMEVPLHKLDKETGEVLGELPILMQSRYGAASVGDRFREDRHASLFALRSFWTGFDAPGETLSCVVLVRVPFEVPIDPPQIARMAYFQTQDRDSFREHTLPNAKMLMRQGAGRLIRLAEDKGVIAILDPRVRTKPYGPEILANFHPGVRVFDDFLDAMAHVGISC